MKKTISAKRVLNELLAEYNAQSIAFSYHRAINDFTIRDQCQAALSSVCDVINGLGFKEGLDYMAEKCEMRVNETTFQYWRREAMS